jgi:hypothetical protein
MLHMCASMFSVPEEDTKFESNKYYCSYSESPFGLLVGFCSLQGRHANDLEITSQARVIGKLTTAYKSCVGIRVFCDARCRHGADRNSCSPLETVVDVCFPLST